MDGWDGWGSPIAEIAETAACFRDATMLEIGAFGYTAGRVTHEDDVSREIALALQADDPMDELCPISCYGAKHSYGRRHEDRTH